MRISKRASLVFMVISFLMLTMVCAKESANEKVIQKEVTKEIVEPKNEKIEAVAVKKVEKQEVKVAPIKEETDQEILYKSFYIFAKRGDTEVLTLYISRNFDVNKPNDQGMTVLSLAAKEGKFDAVQFLLLKDADINFVDGEKNTIAHYVVLSNNQDVMKFILKKGASLDLGNNNGETPIMLAIKNKYFDMGNLLFKSKKFNVNQADNNGKTLLMYAIDSGNIKLVKSLIKRDADIYAKTNKGVDVLDYASTKGDLKAMKLINKIKKKDAKK